jgi:hypothetical protein
MVTHLFPICCTSLAMITSSSLVQGFFTISGFTMFWYLLATTAHTKAHA